MTRFEISGDAAVDRATGLMWIRDAGLGEYPMTWAEAFDWIAGLNAGRPGGFGDWRLPHRCELFSLVSHATINPALPKGHPFRNVFPGYYWTGTTVARLPDQAWYVHLGGARVFKGMKAGSYMVWPVRSGALGEGGGTSGTGGLRPDPRFETREGVVEDLLTGLCWPRKADLASGPVSWETAAEQIAAANRRELLGYDDWRLPHIRELESLCDLQRHSPALPAGHPFQAVREFYWSGTPSRYDPDYAWALYLLDGAVGVGYKPGADFHVWPVRG